MSQGLVLSGLRLARGAPALHLEFPAGVHALVVSKEAEAQNLITLATGCSGQFRGTAALGSATFRGTAALDGENPLKTPALRAALGSLLPQEPKVTSAGTVREWIARLSELRAKHSVPEEPEAPLVSEDLASVQVSSLSRADSRRVALSLALRLSRPRALVLDSPFSSLSPEETAFVLERLLLRAQSGCVVLTVFRTKEQARVLAHAPRVLGAPSQTRSSTATFRYLVHCERPREALRHLAGEPSLLSFHIEPHSQHLLVLECTDERAGAEALTRALVATGAQVFEITPVRGASP